VEELDAVVNKGKIRFDLLWAFFEPGTKLYLQCPHTDAPMCVTFQSGEQTTDNHNETCFSVTSHYVSRSKDGKPGYTLKKILVPYFWGEKDIKDLNIYPLSYHANEEELRRELIERGRKYARLMKDPYSHKMFTGRTFFINAQNEAVVRFADSRIMVDSDSFVKYPPGRHRVPNVMCFQHDMTWDNLDDKNLLICSATAYAYILHLRHFGIFSFPMFFTLSLPCWPLSFLLAQGPLLTRQNIIQPKSLSIISEILNGTSLRRSNMM
jgi:hypothetical protein